MPPSWCSVMDVTSLTERWKMSFTSLQPWSPVCSAQYSAMNYAHCVLLAPSPWHTAAVHGDGSYQK